MFLCFASSPDSLPGIASLPQLREAAESLQPLLVKPVLSSDADLRSCAESAHLPTAGWQFTPRSSGCKALLGASSLPLPGRGGWLCFECTDGEEEQGEVGSIVSFTY